MNHTTSALNVGSTVTIHEEVVIDYTYSQPGRPDEGNETGAILDHRSKGRLHTPPSSLSKMGLCSLIYEMKAPQEATNKHKSIGNGAGTDFDSRPNRKTVNTSKEFLSRKE